MASNPQARPDSPQRDSEVSITPEEAANPTCEMPECPRHGKNMRHAADRSYSVINHDGKRTIAIYLCGRSAKAQKMHRVYRLLPGGEPMDCLGFCHYKGVDSVTGEVVETCRDPHIVARKYSFTVPTCEIPECPRHGLNMKHGLDTPYSVINHDEKRMIARYICGRSAKTQKLHYAYRLLPGGEPMDDFGWCHYKGIDSKTGEVVETCPDPVRIANNLAAKRTPEARARMSKSVKDRPRSIFDKQSESLKLTWAKNPDWKTQKSEQLKELWAKSKTAEQAEAAAALARADVTRLTKELAQAKAQAKTKLAEAKAAAEALPVAEIVRRKLAEPANYPWMSPGEVAKTFGIGRSTLFRNIKDYTRLRPNQTGQYSTLSVIEQLRNPPRKK